MTVKIITDSNADITTEVAKDLDITVVSLFTQSGEEEKTDTIDDELSQQTSPTEQPETEHPLAENFADIYADCAKTADGIISIHASSRTSEVYDAALLGKKLARSKCQIEIIDSTFASVGLALVVMAAARQAKAGKNLLGVFEETQKAIDQVGMLAILDSTENLEVDGQIGKIKLAAAKMMKMKPILTFNKGNIIQAGSVRSSSEGLDRLHEFAASRLTIQDISIAHSNMPEQVEELKSRLSSIFVEEDIYITRLSSSQGVLSCPGTLVLAVRGH